MPDPIKNDEAAWALAQLTVELRVMFREVDGPARAFAFDKPWVEEERGVYDVVGFAAQLEHPGDEERVATGLIHCMRSVFSELFHKGAKTLVWRRHMEMSVMSGGDLVPSQMRISCRVLMLNDAGYKVRPSITWPDGCPPIILTKEQLEDRRL